VAVLLLVHLKPAAVAWGWWRVARGEAAVRHVPGLVFAKALGSGHEGGFGLRPSVDHQGLFAVFGTEQAADGFIASSPIAAAYREHSRECGVLKLRATSSRGTWSRHPIEVTAQVPDTGPVASLTRASIKPLRARAFWRRSPPSEASLRSAQGCRLAVGLGEAPLLRQATFTLWRDQSAMDAYARSGAHQQAIQDAYDGQYFSESMFVRFAVVSASGSWKGERLG